MQIKVLYFAALAAAIGVREQDLSLPDSATVADALACLADEHAALAQGRGLAVTAAVNLEYAACDRVLSDGDVLALIPPVSGG